MAAATTGGWMCRATGNAGTGAFAYESRYRATLAAVRDLHDRLLGHLGRVHRNPREGRFPGDARIHRVGPDDGPVRVGGTARDRVAVRARRAVARARQPRGTARRRGATAAVRGAPHAVSYTHLRAHETR